jgi:hypothetical protein
MSDIAILVENLSKLYHIGRAHASTGLSSRHDTTSSSSVQACATQLLTRLNV